MELSGLKYEKILNPKALILEETIELWMNFLLLRWTPSFQGLLFGRWVISRIAMIIIIRLWRITWICWNWFKWDLHFPTSNGICPRAELISIAFGSSIFVNLMLTRTFLRTIPLSFCTRAVSISWKAMKKKYWCSAVWGSYWCLQGLCWMIMFIGSLSIVVLYDIKHLMKFCNSLHGGLNKLVELLEVERVA